MAAKPHLGDIQLRYATLLSRLGPALDGPGRLGDADAWYFILEGTSEPGVAEAQAMAVTELIAHAAASRTPEPRSILLAADDHSAVSRRVPLSGLYERGRSLGLGVMVSAQSWQGLGRDEDERYRIAATADGGLWLLQTPYPEPLVALAGTRRVLESARKLIGAGWGDEGTTRIQNAWTADPDLVRALGVGQACYIRRKSAVYVQVARPRPSPLSLPAAGRPARTATVPPARASTEGGYRHPPGDPVTGCALWWALTARGDLAPPARTVTAPPSPTPPRGLSPRSSPTPEQAAAPQISRLPRMTGWMPLTPERMPDHQAEHLLSDSNPRRPTPGCPRKSSPKITARSAERGTTSVARRAKPRSEAAERSRGAAADSHASSQKRAARVAGRGEGSAMPRLPGPLSLTTRRRAYFVMMGVCLVLIALAWTLIWRFSILASVVMSAVALVIPPLAAIVANASPMNRQ